MSLSPQVASALTELKQLVQTRFAGRLRRMTLFGSYARGEANEDSDVDVLVVVDALDGRERVAIHDLAAEVWMNTGVRLSPLALSAAELDRLRRLERRIWFDIGREGVAW